MNEGRREELSEGVGAGVKKGRASPGTGERKKDKSLGW